MSSWSGGSSFTNLPSWQGSFNTNLPSSLTSSSGGFSKMLGPIAGIASAGASIFSGFLGNQAAKDSLRMHNAMNNAAIEEARQGRNAEVAFGLGNRNASLYTGPRLAFDLQKEAENYSRQFLAPQDLALSSEASKRERLAAISPEAKERARFENRLAIEKATAEKLAQTNAMFGPISSSYFG